MQNYRRSAHLQCDGALGHRNQNVLPSGVNASLTLGERPFPSLLPGSPPLPPLPSPSLFTLPLPPPSPPFPLEVGPLNPARGSGGALLAPPGVWGGAPAEIEFGAF